MILGQVTKTYDPTDSSGVPTTVKIRSFSSFVANGVAHVSSERGSKPPPLTLHSALHPHVQVLPDFLQNPFVLTLVASRLPCDQRYYRKSLRPVF